MSVPVSKEQLQEWKREGLSDQKIAKKLNVAKSTIYAWRRKLRVAADGEHWAYEVEVCRNPHCGTKSANRYVKGLCASCYNYQKRTGRHRTKDDMYIKGGASGYCKRCKRKPCIARNLCNICLKYLYQNGKPRPDHLVRRGPCKTCGRPYVKNSFARGYCDACYHYRKRHGRERPRELWEAQHWCECRQPATHEVEVTVLSAKGNERTEVYWLCDSCYADERAETNGVEVPRNWRMVGTKV